MSDVADCRAVELPCCERAKAFNVGQVRSRPQKPGDLTGAEGRADGRARRAESVAAALRVTAALVSLDRGRA